MDWYNSHVRTLAAKSIRKSSFLTVVVAEFLRRLRMPSSSRSLSGERIVETVVVQDLVENSTKRLDRG
jgi:hypothetical protein